MSTKSYTSSPKWLWCLLVVCVCLGGLAPTRAHADDLYGKGARINLTPKSYLRLLAWGQVWARYQQFNPGTQIQEEDAPGAADFGLRRFRLLFLSQIGDKILILAHFGINNQTFNNTKKPQLFFHDAWVEYKVLGQYLAIGGGLHYWHGISRMTNASTLNFLGLDAPIVNWPLIEATDQFARQIGFFAKGKIAGFDYRVAVNRPFSPTGTPGTNVAAFNKNQNTFSVAGYFQYQFMEQESNTLPYHVGSYLGKRSIFNIGFGFQVHPEGTVSLDDQGAQVKHTITLLGADVFLDIPFKGAGALTFYGVYYYFDFGPNFLRNIGIMNIGTGGTSLNGAGNRYPTIGTGHHFYAQAGYVLPLPTKVVTIQPYVGSQLSLFEALDGLSPMIEAGVNVFFLGHHSKLTLHYRNRPIFEQQNDGKKTNTQSASEVILQLMVFI